MRILHFSDLHIGVENYGQTDPETGLSTRLADFLSSLDEVVDYALTEDVDLVLLAGDAYKGRDPSQTHQREFAKRLARLSEAAIPTFLLVGNHDLPNAVSRATAVEILGGITGRISVHLFWDSSVCDESSASSRSSFSICARTLAASCSKLSNADGLVTSPP